MDHNKVFETSLNSKVALGQICGSYRPSSRQMTTKDSNVEFRYFAPAEISAVPGGEGQISTSRQLIYEMHKIPYLPFEGMFSWPFS